VGLAEVLVGGLVLDEQFAEPEQVNAAQSPLSLRTGSSKLATVRRRTPKTLKNSFQKDWRSAASRVSPRHSLLKAMARWRISFQESGMGGG
jgi:mitochondrial fission protein ELM1